MSKIKELIALCKENGITIEQYVLLSLTDDKPKLAEYINDLNNSVGLLKGLHRKGLIKFMSADMDNYSRIEYTVLTPKGIDLVESFIDDAEPAVDNLDWIDEYRNIFKPAKSSGGRPIIGSKAACSKKLERFLREHPNITKEEILKAAQNYMTKMSKQNYTYVTCADYFIYKRKNDGVEVSLLEAEIEYVKDGHIESTGDEFTVKL